MTLAFDEVKATQTAARFLRLAGGSLNYTALIKLLYKADREALGRWGLPITTDKYVSMKLGPVTSHIYNRIKSSADQGSHPTFWAAHIGRSGPHDVSLHADPGDSELSAAEEALIDETYAAHGHKEWFCLADECHRDFPEWKDPGNSSIPLEIADIISALGLSEEEAKHIESLIEKQRASVMLSA